MRKPFALLCLASLLLVAMLQFTALAADRPVDEFTIELEAARKDYLQADLIDLFIRETENQTQIVLTLKNRKTHIGRAKVSFYYLEELRVRPGNTLRVKPEGRARPYEGIIQTIEVRLLVNQQPRIVFTALSEPPEEKQLIRPYPRLATEGFEGRLALDTTAQEGEKKPFLVSCDGFTPGDLRIRFGTRADVVGVGEVFSTVYVMDDVRHTYNANNGLRTQYFGTQFIQTNDADD